jgi:alpha-ribazole phosphatase
MEVYLVRHTTPDIEKGICYGQADLPLAPSFPEELQSILEKHPKLKNADSIYSSPLQRCKQLAEALEPKQLHCDPRLQELHFGDWELKPWDAIPPAEMTPWMEDFVNYPCPNGESFVNLYNRVLSFKDDLLKTNADQSIIVTHAGVIRSFLSYVNDTPLVKAFDYKVAYGEVITINLS